MKTITQTTLATLLLATLFSGVLFAAEKFEPKFKKTVLDEKFYAEGAYYADFNKDGNLDIVAGPFWYQGPDFKIRHEYTEVKECDLEGYSEFFFHFTGDYNGDGWEDIFAIGFPGGQGRWYENPKGGQGHWKMTLAVPSVGGESPMIVDMNADGQLDLIYVKDGLFGYGSFDTKNPYELWTFHPISSADDKIGRAGHGIGHGDINGDGRTDMLASEGWWEAPSDLKSTQPWKFHRFDFADAAAQILVFDVDGDGKNDVVTSHHCHLYGLAWFKQIRNAQGEITWEKHEILSQTPDVESDALRISQLHAFDQADFNHDGVTDFVTGKRRWAHGSKGDVEPNAPFVLYWFETQRTASGQTKIVPHLIDDHSGVGTQVAAVDLNKDGLPDILTSNKNGTFIFFHSK